MDDTETRLKIAAMANAMGDDTRLRLVSTLLSAGSSGLAVSDLAQQLGLAQPRISTHLAILKEVGLVEGRTTGRTRIYRAFSDRALPLLDAIKTAAGLPVVPPPSLAASREIARNSPYRNARTCYDHLAGLVAVDLLDEFIFDRWLVREGGSDERPQYLLTDGGRAGLTRLGVDVIAAESSSRRTLACGCLDWTERRPHLAGSLGAAVLTALERDGYLARIAGEREVTLVKPIADWLAAA